MHSNTENQQHHEETQHHEEHTPVGGILHAVADTANIAHMAHIHVSGPLRFAGPLAEVGAEIMHNTSDNIIERVICGTGIGLAREAINRAVAVHTGAIAGMGASIGTPVVGAGVAIGVGVTAYRITDVFTSPAAAMLTRACHDSFTYVRNKQSAAKRKLSQQAQAVTNLSKSRVRDNGLNFFRPSYHFGAQSIFTQTSISTRNHSLYPSVWFGNKPSNYGKNTFMQSQGQHHFYEIRRAVREAIQSEMTSLVPSFSSAYLKAQMKLGFLYTLTQTEFRNVVASTKLTNTYNSLHPNAKMRDLSRFTKEIGGVAFESGLIEDFINSDAHALAENLFFCFKEDELENIDQGLIEQLFNDMENSYSTTKTHPFVSIHFNNHGSLYTIMHPSLKNTLAGEITAFLDYWVKGFLNGGFFNKTFLRNWAKEENLSEDYLRANMIDLREYCDIHCQEINYQSLREKMAERGLEFSEKIDSGFHGERYKTSFRIIAFLEKIERFENLLLPYPDFRIEYSVDVMPDYQKYLDECLRENGSYPSDYLETLYVYQRYAEEIKNSLPKISLCREFFKLLGLMNTFGYLLVTMDKIGKEVVVNKPSRTTTYQVPKALPPYPVRSNRTYPFQLPFNELLKTLAAKGTIFDAALSTLFKTSYFDQLPNIFEKHIEAMVKEQLTTVISPQLAAHEKTLNRLEIKKIRKTIEDNLLELFLQFAGIQQQKANTCLEEYLLGQELQKTKKLTLLEKWKCIENLYVTEFETTLASWKTNPHPEKMKDTLLKKCPQNLHAEIEKEFLTLQQYIEGLIPETVASVQREHRIQCEAEKKDLINYLSETRKRIMDGQMQAHAEPVNEVYENFLKKSKEELLKHQNSKIICQTNSKVSQQNKQVYSNKIAEYQIAIAQGQQTIAKCNELIAEASALHHTFVPKIHGHKKQELINQINADIAQKNGLITTINAEIVLVHKNIALLNTHIAEENSDIATYTNNITLLDQAILSIPQEVQAVTNSFTKSLVEAMEKDQEQRLTKILSQVKKNAQELFASQSLGISIKIYSLVQKIRIDAIAQSKREITEFPVLVEKLLTYSSLHTNLIEEYMHSSLDFNPREDHKIIGGCSIRIPNIHCQPLAQGKAFIQLAKENRE